MGLRADKLARAAAVIAQLQREAELYLRAGEVEHANRRFRRAERVEQIFQEELARGN